MAPIAYKKRRRAFEGEEGRMQAISRLKNEANARTKMVDLKRSKEPISHDRPEAQQRAAEKLSGPRRHETTRGLRRLSFREAYSRRTTDTSRNRVLSLYGRKAPPKGFANRSYQPVSGTGSRKLTPSTRTRNTGDYRAGLPDAVARMRSKSTRRRRQLPTFGSPRAGANSRRKYF